LLSFNKLRGDKPLSAFAGLVRLPVLDESACGRDWMADLFAFGELKQALLDIDKLCRYL